MYHSPPPGPPAGDYLGGYSGGYQLTLSPPPPIQSGPSIQPSPAATSYTLHDGPSGYGFADHEEQDQLDTGDIPLLRRDTPGGPMPIPGGYDQPADDDPESNIRYGRIPQRVPRRYKTIKRVEYVLFLLVM